MKILKILNEYNTEITLQKFGSKLEPIAKKRGYSDAKSLLGDIEKMDPTKNKQYVLWLLKQFLNSKFRAEDYPRVNDVLQKFISIKNRLPVDKRDIGRLDFHSLEDMVDKIYNTELGVAQISTSDRKIPEDAEALYNGPLGLLVIPKTEEASCELGKGTKWCTAASDNNMFNHYSEDGPLYIWIDKNGEKYQFHFQSLQFMDAKDKPLSHDKVVYFREEHPVLKKWFHKQEQILIKQAQRANFPEDLVDYAEVMKIRFKEAEETISTDWFASFKYAEKILKGRFPEGENAIAQNAESAYNYAKLINDRFELGEEAIADDAESSWLYAKDVLKRRFEPGENIIFDDIHFGLAYCIHFGIRSPKYERSLASVYSQMPWQTEVYTKRYLLNAVPKNERQSAIDNLKPIVDNLKL